MDEQSESVFFSGSSKRYTAIAAGFTGVLITGIIVFRKDLIKVVKGKG
jgi:hypothetical protein